MKWLKHQQENHPQSWSLGRHVLGYTGRLRAHWRRSPSLGVWLFSSQWKELCQSQVEYFPWPTAMRFHTLLWESQGVQSPRGILDCETLQRIATGCQHWNPENLSPGWLPSTVFLCLKVPASGRPTVCRICLRGKKWCLSPNLAFLWFY